ncbi:3-ketoacyl-ACP synthase [Acidihalobacter aeolianus]|uniref:3-ketoacyl-ACP synthase n=1 Tax=Acidihalobacter aeolianus TaxID=2792603 RepID=A0A1D8KBY3_9GAMM|nr:SDR family oxidoreductase [Acidihalobacter aeolianus]AOV18450.1 3-ketoacyl-ACP synthase [Acidihalobacter aeolianus]
MDLGLSGKWVAVTGGTAGIGAAIVEGFAREGANVAFCSRSAERVGNMLSVLARYPVEKRGAVVDVTDGNRLSRWLEDLARIDVFVPNVSAISPDWETTLETDLRATVRATEAAIPRLAAAGSSAITYIGSKAATFGTPGYESYGAAKAALTHYMKSLSRRLVGQGIRVNTVAPGDVFVEGGFWDRIRREQPAAFRETLEANPLGRLATPEEIADVVVFLSSPRASFVTGAHYLVDGGATLHVQS